MQIVVAGEDHAEWRIEEVLQVDVMAGSWPELVRGDGADEREVEPENAGGIGRYSREGNVVLQEGAYWRVSCLWHLEELCENSEEFCLRAWSGTAEVLVDGGYEGRDVAWVSEVSSHVVLPCSPECSEVHALETGAPCGRAVLVSRREVAVGPSL